MRNFSRNWNPLKKPMSTLLIPSELESFGDGTDLAPEFLTAEVQMNGDGPGGSAQAVPKTCRKSGAFIALLPIARIEGEERARGRRLGRAGASQDKAAIHVDPGGQRVPARPVGDGDLHAAPGSAIRLQLGDPPQERHLVPVDLDPSGRVVFRAARPC